MELLNPAFVLLLIKITVCVLPGVLGVYLLSTSEDKRRELRSFVCSRLFGVSNAIPFSNFERAILITGVLGLLISAVASWFLLFAGMFLDHA